MGACSSTPSSAVVANASGPTKANNPAGGILQTKNDGAPDTGGAGGGKGVTFAANKAASSNNDSNATASTPTSHTTNCSTPSTDATNNRHSHNNNNNPASSPIEKGHVPRHPSQDFSVSSNFSTDSSGSNQSAGNKNDSSHSSSNRGKYEQDLLTTSHRRRKSRQLNHSDSKLGLTDIISGDLKNPNLVRIEVPLGKPIEEVYEGVHDGPVLGSGISGIVRLVKHRATQVSYAVKCLDLALIDSEEGLKQLKEEIYIMCQLDHPNIVRLEEVYESHSEIYLVQEVCKGGELFDRLDEQPDYHYTEAQCARLVKQMLSSVRYIHNKGIIHRDLKLENFLFSELDSESELKMIDFGLSKHFTFGEVHHEAVGTPYTVAPEVIRGSYDERCDVWAIGVITYLLLSGEPPFGGCGGPETLMQVRDNILRGSFRFEPADVWETVSPEAIEFIKSLLVLDPMERPTARQAKESKWLKMWSNREKNGNDSNINPNVVKALVGFKEYSDMRKLLCEVLSFTLLPEQIQGLRQEFEKYDQEGTGEITLDTLKKVLIGNASTGSLGGLTEEEVVDIFNAMRVRKGETSIHWHDFIAAGLSQCQVDDRNLRLAFERLDQEHKGYITFENVIDLMGDDTFDPNEDQMLMMWGESMKDVNCKSALINYEDFVLLMKGQKRDRAPSIRNLRSSLESVPENLRSSLDPVRETAFEETFEEGVGVHTPEFHPLSLADAAASNKEMGMPKFSESPIEISPDLLPLPPRTPTGTPSPSRKNFIRTGSNSAPPTPIHFGRRFDEIEQRTPSSLSMDEDDVARRPSSGGGRVTFNEQCVSAKFTIPDLDLTPPQTPVRGPADYVTPTVARASMNPQLISQLAPPDLELPTGTLLPGTAAKPLQPFLTTRGRSVSLDEKDTQVVETRLSYMFKRDSRRAMAIPEHTHNVSAIDRVIEDQTKTPLFVNRKLYRAHREFRHAVTEACKRFEDEQMRRAKETLRAQNDANTVGSKHTAGLVMRHGQALTDSSIKTFLKNTLEEQQKQIDQSYRRGGRGRRSRKKTTSDLSGMLAGPASPPAGPEVPQTATPARAERKTVARVERKTFVNPPNDKLQEEALAPVKENERLLRNPTKPGEFRKTNYDPFQRKSLFEPSSPRFAPSLEEPPLPPPPPLE